MDDQSPGPQRKLQASSQYFIGLGIGLIPLILALITIGGLAAGFGVALGFSLVLYLYGALLVASIVCLCVERIRFVGYGLLTMFIAIPIISFIGCLVITTLPH